MAQTNHQSTFVDLLDLSPFVDEMQVDDAQLMPPPPRPRDDIAVFVSGQTFYMIPSLFEKVQGLSWYQVGGLPHLDAEADLFEVVLQFYLTGTLPSKALVKKRRESLQQLVAPLLDAHELQACVNRINKWSSSSKGQSSSNKRRLSLRKGNKKNPSSSSQSSQTKKSNGFFASFNRTKEDQSPAMMKSKAFDDLDDSHSDASGYLSQVTQASTATSMSEKENPKKRQKGMNGWRIRNRSSNRRLHESLCSSEYIV